MLHNIKSRTMGKMYRLNTKLLMTLNHVIGMTNSAIMEATGINNTTWYTILRNPNCITIQQLLAVANGLKIPVSRFFTTESYDMIERPDDYVTHPYISCYYDGEAFRHIINTTPVTWTKLSELTGVTRGHARNSLLSATRLPVSRFLKVCEGFSIEPFTILIDPNPALTKTKSKHGRTANDIKNIPPTNFAALHNTINQLRTELENARQLIEENRQLIHDLTHQCQSLQNAQETLARRINVNIHSISDSSISIAADAKSDSYGEKSEK